MGGQNQAKVTEKCTQRKEAVAKYVTAPITIRGQSYTPQQLEAGYQSCIDTRAALALARQQSKRALQARQQADAEMQTQDEALQSWVDATYGPQSDQAVAFGYATKPKVKATATDKAAAAVKAQQTRKALGTKGPKQKKAAKKQLAAQQEAETTPAAAPAAAAAAATTTATAPKS
jgi:hypothetical protein